MRWGLLSPFMPEVTEVPCPQIHNERKEVLWPQNAESQQLPPSAAPLFCFLLSRYCSDVLWCVCVPVNTCEIEVPLKTIRNLHLPPRERNQRFGSIFFGDHGWSLITKYGFQNLKKKITIVFCRCYNLILINYQNIGIHKEKSVHLVNN